MRDRQQQIVFARTCKQHNRIRMESIVHEFELNRTLRYILRFSLNALRFSYLLTYLLGSLTYIS